MYKLSGIVSFFLSSALFISLAWFFRGAHSELSFIESFLFALILSVIFEGPLLIAFKSMLGGDSDE